MARKTKQSANRIAKTVVKEKIVKSIDGNVLAALYLISRKQESRVLKNLLKKV